MALEDREYLHLPLPDRAQTFRSCSARWEVGIRAPPRSWVYVACPRSDRNERLAMGKEESPFPEVLQALDPPFYSMLCRWGKRTKSNRLVKDTEQFGNTMIVRCREQVLVRWSAGFCGRWDNLSGLQPVPRSPLPPGYGSGACRERAVCQTDCSGSSRSSHPAPALPDGCLAALPSHEGYMAGM